MSGMGGPGDPMMAGGRGDRGGQDMYGYGGGKDLRRTPSTSAIYETLRRSKELRESLSSRPSSRLSLRGDSTVRRKWPILENPLFIFMTVRLATIYRRADRYHIRIFANCFVSHFLQ